MDAYERAIISQAQALVDLVLVSPSSVQVEIYRMWKKAFGLSSSPTQVSNSPNMTPSPASLSSSEPSNGTSLETQLTSMLASLETLTQRLRVYAGPNYHGTEIYGPTKLWLKALTTVTT